MKHINVGGHQPRRHCCLRPGKPVRHLRKSLAESESRPCCNWNSVRGYTITCRTKSSTVLTVAAAPEGGPPSALTSLHAHVILPLNKAGRSVSMETLAGDNLLIHGDSWHSTVALASSVTAAAGAGTRPIAGALCKLTSCD